MNAEQLLASLQDIQAPPAPPWWYIAPAWWVLGGGLVLLLLLLWSWLRYRNANRAQLMAVRGLRQIEASYARNGDVTALAQQLSQWLKQVALLAYPEHRLESMTGRSWVEFLARQSGEPRFRQGIGEIFAGTVYSSRVETDASQLIALCENWLRAVKPRLLGQGRD